MAPGEHGRASRIGEGPRCLSDSQQIIRSCHLLLVTPGSRGLLACLRVHMMYYPLVLREQICMSYKSTLLTRKRPTPWDPQRILQTEAYGWVLGRCVFFEVPLYSKFRTCTACGSAGLVIAVMAHPPCRGGTYPHFRSTLARHTPHARAFTNGISRLWQFMKARKQTAVCILLLVVRTGVLH